MVFSGIPPRTSQYPHEVETGHRVTAYSAHGAARRSEKASRSRACSRSGSSGRGLACAVRSGLGGTPRRSTSAEHLGGAPRRSTSTEHLGGTRSTARGDLTDAGRAVGEARLPPDERGPIPEGLRGECEQPGQAKGSKTRAPGRTPTAAAPAQGPAGTPRRAEWLHGTIGYGRSLNP